MTRDELEDMAWDEPHVAAEWIIRLREMLEIAINDGPVGYLEWVNSAKDLLEETESNQ